MNYDFYNDMSIMDNPMGFIDSNQYTGFDILENNVNYQNNKKSLNLFNPYEGYLKGNGFKDEYKPYKNYKVAKINIDSEKDEMLISIGEYSFMMHDINLYLDIHPNDSEALNKFTEYRNKVNDLITKYERKYGPIGVKGNISNNTPFAWENQTWPWVN